MYNSYDYGYGYSSASVFAGFGIAYVVIMLTISALIVVSYWKIFVKAGKPGWAAIVPIYNFIVMSEIAEKPWWYVLLLCVPIANIYAMVVVYNGIAKKFGKGTGYTVGMIFLSIIFVPMLAFSKTK